MSSVRPLAAFVAPSTRGSQAFAQVFAAGVTAFLTGSAVAQTLNPPPTVPSSLRGSETHQVWQRLDPLAIAIVLVGLLIALLLIVRIVQMIRRERSARTALMLPTQVGKKVGKKPPRARRAPSRTPQTASAPLGAPTITSSTDWGFDQNKRSATSRATTGSASESATALDMSAAQWSRSEVQNAAQQSFQPGEAMGKPTNLPPSPYRTSHNPYYRGDAGSDGAEMEVEEVADVLLQAELLVQLGDPKQAMLLLSQHIHDTEKPGPAVWLMLLSLYQATGRKAQYDALARGFKTLFNAAVPPWAKAGEAGARDLDTYSQVMMRLQTGWPKPETREFLEQLLNDDRGGSRQGFTLQAYREILFLIDILDVLAAMAREDADREQIRDKLAPPR